jgi:hypothetical protein
MKFLQKIKSYANCSGSFILGKFQRFNCGYLIKSLFFMGIVSILSLLAKYFFIFECNWCDKFLLGFVVSFCFTIIKTVIVIKKTKNINKKEPQKISNTPYKKDKEYYRRALINQIINKIRNLNLYYFSAFITRVFVFFINSSTIYCATTESSDVSNKSKTEEKEIKKDKIYKISASVAKGDVKESVRGAVEGIESGIPVVEGGLAGGQLGAPAIKAASKFSPFQKAVLGVTSAVVVSF